jgi:hypothetical protein
VDATFAAFGITALYTPAGGDPAPIRVIARRPDTTVGLGETRIYAETATFELRASEVASPRPDDKLTVGSDTFIVQGEPERRDPDRLAWRLDVRSAWIEPRVSSIAIGLHDGLNRQTSTRLLRPCKTGPQPVAPDAER